MTKKELQQKITEQVINDMKNAINDIANMTQQTVNYGFTCHEAFPAEDYRMVEVNGVTYQLRIKIDLLTEEECAEERVAIH